MMWLPPEIKQKMDEAERDAKEMKKMLKEIKDELRDIRSMLKKCGGK